ncbi:MAG: hypothetical protein ABII82_18700 [Verrucomicrobiota bacterium]
MRILQGFAPHVSVLCLLTGCAGVDATGGRPALSDDEPVPSAEVSRLQAWQDAEALAALDADRLTVIGSGASMRPVYGENTVLVLQKVDYEELAAGMTVAYRNEAGRVVVHTLLNRESNGWRIAGLNNSHVDRGRVTRHNLIGTVYASFAHDDVR